MLKQISLLITLLLIVSDLSALTISLSKQTAEVTALCPRLLIGETNLFVYESATVKPSKAFTELLELLVRLKQLDPKALEARTLAELNQVLQMPQGSCGGLMRKPGSEVWDLRDNSVQISAKPELERLFGELGFALPVEVDAEKMVVTDCPIFGATANRMEERIQWTVGYLNKHLTVTGHVFLLGSTRRLIPKEIEYLRMKVDALSEPYKKYWSEVFADPCQATEANAFIFLWKCGVSDNLQNALAKKLVTIKSTRIGPSFHDTEGTRTTTEVTAEDVLKFYADGTVHSIFAITEQPYRRLADQYRVTVLTKAKTATLAELIGRIKRTTFLIAAPLPDSPPLISMVLDEIGRNVYRMNDTYNYLESLKG